MSEHDIEVEVNGVSISSRVEARTSLADHLRDGLGLTGTHVACGIGECGACTVLIDGTAVRSCLVLAVQVDSHRVETIERADEATSDLASELVARNGFQCGFCAPAIMMAVRAAMRAGATGEDIADEVLNSHFCRCTGYVNARAVLTKDRL